MNKKQLDVKDIFGEEYHEYKMKKRLEEENEENNK